MVFQDLYNESIFLGIDKIIQKQDIKALACLIASCLKDEDGCVGMEFVKEIDLMNGLPFFMEKIGELMENSLPMEEDEDKKKPKQKKN